MTHTLLRFWILLAALGACRQASPAGGESGGEVSSVAVPAAISSADLRALDEDPAVRAARAAIDAGHPWRATQILAPVLRVAARRTPAALLVAARAAAGWSGWGEVDKLLAGQAWVDSRFGGEGRELLARSALARNDDSAAVANATAAARRKGDARTTHAVRLVLLARALDRMNLRDSASATYSRAAGLLPSVRDWLLLRAAGVQDDSAARARLYARITAAPARARIPYTEPLALERSGHLPAAIAAYRKVGDDASAFRLRFAEPTDSVARVALVGEALAFVGAHVGTGEARQVIALVDQYAAMPLTPDQELLVARSTATSGPLARAVTAFGRAGTARLSARDRLRYADVLSRLGRDTDAARVLADIAPSDPVAPDASYSRARSLLRAGDGAAARTALRETLDRFPRDTAAAASALYLLADLATDDQDDAAARRDFARLASEYPTSSRADDALFRAGIIAFVDGDHVVAAREFDSLASRYPRSGEVNAARYWAGRAFAAVGDSSTAVARWRTIIADEPLSYYAGRAAARLGTARWSLPAGAPNVPHVAAVDAAIARATLLERLGMDTEAGFEYDALENAANRNPVHRLATAAALRDHGQTSRAIRLAFRSINAGARTRAAYRIAYPLVDSLELARNARAHDLDPAFVAALIRQESSFNPRAQSAAGARGLMQVMPSVGEQVARSLGFPVWDPKLLFDPDANLQLGTAHLAAALKETSDTTRALAAYNAGVARVARWSTKRGVADPELFAERIPFVETRDYVRIVQRNMEIYRTLYFNR